MELKQSAFLLILLIGANQALDWTPSSQGNIPQQAVSVRLHGKQLGYFCKVLDQALNKSFVGTIVSREKTCFYVDEINKTVLTSQSYQVLSFSSSSEKVQFVFKPRGQVPGNAISCGEDCYLGMSLYSDGVCDEKIGRISSKLNMIYLNKKLKFKKCPFFLFMTKVA